MALKYQKYWYHTQNLNGSIKEFYRLKAAKKILLWVIFGRVRSEIALFYVLYCFFRVEMQEKSGEKA
jgi:hypothetical protein